MTTLENKTSRCFSGNTGCQQNRPRVTPRVTPAVSDRVWNYFTLDVSPGTVTIYFRPEGIYRLSLSPDEFFSHALEPGEPPWPGFINDLEKYFAGKGKDICWDYPLIMDDYTPWTSKILQLAAKIPFGQTCTYRQLAEKAGSPRAARAVGQALGRNRTPVLIPCHRIIGTRGNLVGFGGGLRWKRELLKLEGIAI